jgi:hypothetical protein
MAARTNYTFEIATNQSRGTGCIAGIETVDRQLTISEKQDFLRRLNAKEFEGDTEIGEYLLRCVIVDEKQAPTAKWLSEKLMTDELLEFIFRVMPQLKPAAPTEPQ